ncbi:protein-tyrosine phosphatase-like protein [Ilyonectria robusta]|uniref:protein-tyrosine phosphatase-like protein n=1 Tax=Ilyonectria robusta TaxID=1079257 RepID=UPI001E8DD821|nr:protein-tyrosine phosphatase-like protein [Ilyonectria robusta]KAH8686715.1 protein-tyrosine phosphatase-like protein [Ilyonectria robusta]
MEARKIVENIQGIYGGQTTNGTIRLTDYHLVFSAPIDQSGTPAASQPNPPGGPPKVRERWITFPMICYCTFRPVPPGSRQAPSIRLRCRDFTFVTFNFADGDAARDTFDFIRARTCKLGTVEKLYAFSHKPLKHERAVNGWAVYDPRAEFRRQGISEKLPDRGWRITHINKDYTFCDTYPAFLVVPSKISDNVLKYAREFRSRNRVPALSYIHPINNCTITRSSQPLAGITRKTNVQDEKLVAASFSALMPAGSEDSTPLSSQPDISNGGSFLERELSETERYEEELISKSAAVYDEKTGKRLLYGAQQSNLIVDARPTINAMVNQVQGMGSENMDKYKFARKIFLSIENIHVMRSSLAKVIDAIKDADISPLPPSKELLHQSGWLRHIHDVLDGSAIITRQVGINHSHVLIHCSDGWDRTSQLSALAQIMLDPYYRTMEGFIVLVEKDWLSFGHMFRLRSGHLNHEDWFTIQKDALAGAKVQPGENDGRNDAFQNVLSGAKRFFNQNLNQNKDDGDLDTISETASGKVVNEEATTPKMISPVFHQFLDCTYQLLRQNKTRFEYNERFLRRLLYHLYSCQYGTFLYNSEKQRHDARAPERTSSVWDYFLCRKAEFTNPDFDPTIDDHVKGQERIILPRLKEIRWWHQLFGRTEDEMNGALNAAATAENDRQAAISSFQYPSVAHAEQEPRSSSTSSDNPSLAGNRSVLAGVENAHEALTPDTRHATMERSASAEGGNAFAAIREGITGLNLGKNMLATFGQGEASSSSSTPAPTRTRSDQELREMA